MDRESRDQIAEALIRNARRPRKHASFFDWDDKQQKEHAICDILASHLEAEEDFEQITTITPGDDPPDCVMQCGSSKVAVEITELVNQQAIQYQITNRSEFEVLTGWSDKLLSQELKRIITSKDLNQGIYDQALLLIHTDEPELTVSAFDEMCPGLNVEHPTHFDHVYIIFGYDPRLEICPVRRLC